VSASQEDDREEKLRAAVNIYEYQHEEHTPQYPTLTSVDRDNGTPIPWGALSGLVAGEDGYLYSVEDGTFQHNRIFKINTDDYPAIIEEEIRILDTNGLLNGTNSSTHSYVNNDSSVNIDSEGIAMDDDGNFWIASEGAGNAGDGDVTSVNMLLHVTPDGTIVNVITLPEALNTIQSEHGFQGVAYHQDKLVVVMQRAWGDETEPRIGVYHLLTNEWEFFYYPLETPRSQNGGWVGLSDIAPIGNDQYLVLENDDQAGPDGVIKIVTLIDLGGMEAGGTLVKTVVADLVPELLSHGGLLIKSVEGLAVTEEGDVWVVNDNMGTDDNSGETQLMELGCLF